MNVYYFLVLLYKTNLSLKIVANILMPLYLIYTAQGNLTLSGLYYDNKTGGNNSWLFLSLRRRYFSSRLLASLIAYCKIVVSFFLPIFLPWGIIVSLVINAPFTSPAIVTIFIVVFSSITYIFHTLFLLFLFE